MVGPKPTSVTLVTDVWTDNHVLQAAYSILSSMQEWIRQLPEQFRLYLDGGRRRYQREVYELHINYFVLITMFFHLCGRAVHAAITNPTALIASSCITRLYEEILCREEMAYLLPAHNWFISVGCLPQIHALSGSAQPDTTCQEELDILRRALQTMGIKWPQANVLRSALDRLQEKRMATSSMDRSRPEVVESREADHQVYLGDGDSSVLNGLIRQLFPFPDSMCPRMDMLDAIDPIRGTERTEGIGPLFRDEQYNFNWAMEFFLPSNTGDGYENFWNPDCVGNGWNI